MKNVLIHVLRGVSYVAFPIGTFLFALFVLSVAQNELDFTTASNVCLNVAAILLFFIPPAIILFLHPQPRGSNGAIPQTEGALISRVKYYGLHLIIIIALTAVGIALLVLYILFMGAVFGG